MPALQVDHEDHDNKALNAFNQLWETKFAKDSLLVFSTGRSHALYSDLRVTPSHESFLASPAKHIARPLNSKFIAGRACCTVYAGTWLRA